MGVLLGVNWKRISMWTAGIALGLGGACALALHFLVDPELLKRTAREKARAAWSRELHMEDVSVRLWPMPSIHAAKVSFANPSWAREPNLVQAGEVSAELALIPLLTGKVRLKSLTLEDVVASLEVADDGAVSWELSGESAPVAAKPKGPTDADLLQVEQVNIRNVAIRHRVRGKDAEPVVIQEARLRAEPGLRDVRIEATLRRHAQPLAIKASFADLSKLGVEAAVSDGKLELEWPQSKASLEGRFPLQKKALGHELRVALESESLQPLLAFFGFKRERTAPVRLRFESRQAGERIELARIEASLGNVKVGGDARVNMASDHPEIEARLEAERVDWKKALADSGGIVRPKHHDEIVFHEDRVAWRAVTALGKLRGSADVRMKQLKLGNGLELSNVRTRVAFHDEHVELKPFAAELLGGSAQGSFTLDGRAKAIRVFLDGDKLLMERWFQERGSKVPLRGGPTKVHAVLTLAGATYRDLASSVSGNLTLRMGRAVWESKRAGQAEEMMINVLVNSPRDIEFECAAASLDFRNGRATGPRIVGARSSASQLLTSGQVDFREERIDLRGRVKPLAGAPLGLAAIAGDVQVSGRLGKPTMRLDPAEKPAVLARAGVAIATAGATLLGSAVLDAASEKIDACEAVFR